jgi:hypothetical protein
MTAVLVYLAVVAGEAQLSGAQYEAGGRCPLNERKRMHISPAKGMCALAGWQGGSSHGKVESGFLFVSRVQTRGKGKSQDWQSQSGTFLFAGPSRFHHTHTHTSNSSNSSNSSYSSLSSEYDIDISVSTC